MSNNGLELSKKGLKGPFFIFVLLLIVACNSTKPQTFEESIDQLQEHYSTRLFTISSIIAELSESTSTEEQQKLYLQARSLYKQIEPILQYDSDANYKFLNGPNILRVEEEDLTNIKELEVTGLQLIEELVYDNGNIEDIQYHAKLTSDRFRLIAENTDFRFIKAHHILWMIRDGILRVGITGITPFDSPVLGAELVESQDYLNGLSHIISHFEFAFTSKELYENWKLAINKAQNELNEKPFDAYSFIKDDQQQLLRIWLQTVKDWQVSFPLELAVSNNAQSLFDQQTFNMAYFAKRKTPDSIKSIALLGKKLFSETRLSSTNSVSCASCHLPENYFTDGKRVAFDGTRNTPSLYYSGYQQAFFYDNRSGSLEGQIVSVINNENEFHSSVEMYAENLESNEFYVNSFKTLFESEINDNHIRDAIAAYIRTLNPFNSKFDRNMRGEEVTLTSSEINGFNLFMGKGQCATCHFLPLFNGTVPTKFAESEMELIGVPATNDTIDVSIDPDLGRYYVFNTEKRKYFFKTPTIRNIEMTAPYMHNGVYQTLEEVVDFYNRGGGQGMGIELPYQTLPPEPLELTDKEQKDLVAFMKSLTDERP